MTQLPKSLHRISKAIAAGISDSKEFRFLLLLIVLLLSVSTAFFKYVEHWSTIDALYFSVMTMSTIGYGDLVPQQDISKLFVVFYAFLSFGTFVAFTAKGIQFFINHNKKLIERRNGGSGRN